MNDDWAQRLMLLGHRSPETSAPAQGMTIAFIILALLLVVGTAGWALRRGLIGRHGMLGLLGLALALLAVTLVFGGYHDGAGVHPFLPQ
jgi:hypothetical protein